MWLFFSCDPGQIRYDICSGQIVVERGGTVFPFRFLAEERRSPSLHDDSYLQYKQQIKNVR